MALETGRLKAHTGIMAEKHPYERGLIIGAVLVVAVLVLVWVFMVGLR